MTIPTDDEQNLAAAFDFGLGTEDPSIAVAEPLTRRAARVARVDSRSLAVPIVIGLLIVGVVGGAAFTGWYLVTSSEDEVKADSAAFCAALAETPGVLEQPGFGWPTEGADLTTTLELMQGYQTRWESIAKIAPPTIKKDVARVATAAGVVAHDIEASKSIDRPASLAAIDAVTSKTAIRPWADNYCD